MGDRKKSTITIYRDGAELLTIPITKECKRVFKLMKDDYVKLSFITAEPLEFRINDYIDDEIFGKFYMSKRELGTWNAKDGVYKYELTFVAEYMLWDNYEYMYTSQEILNIGTESGELIRKESDWFFTANLEKHLEMIQANLKVLGFDYGFEIHKEEKGEKVYHNNVSKADEVKYQQNKPQSIIKALNKLAEDYECEWWVERKVIHFGKCVQGEPIELDPRLHFSNYSVKDNRKEYCNVIRAYGGDKNIPTSYRKELYLFIDESFTHNGTLYWIDSSKKLSVDFFQEIGDTEFQLFTSRFVRKQASPASEHYVSEGNWHDSLSRYETYTFNGSVIIPSVTFKISNYQSHTRTARGVARVYIEYEDKSIIPLKEKEGEERTYINQNLDLESLSIPINNAVAELKPKRRFRIVVEYRCEVQLYQGEMVTGVPDGFKYGLGADEDLEISAVSGNKGKGTIDVTYYESGEKVETQIKISPIEYTHPDTYKVIKYGLTTTETETRDNVFKKGRVFLVNTYDNVDIPQAYYLDSLNDPSNIARLGSRRLRLPVYDEFGVKTDGVILDYKNTRITEFKDTLCLGKIWVLGGRPVFMRIYGSTEDIEWEKFTKPFSQDNYKAGYYELTDLKEGEVVMFGNIIERGITNMVRWIVYDKDGNIIDYSKANQSADENSYKVSKDCAYIICSHYHTSTPYIEVISFPPIRGRVEKTIMFNDIFPKMQLYVNEIKTTERTDKETFEGEGEVTKEWNWLEYTITLQTHDGRDFKDFRFRNKYILQDEKLQIQFLYNGALNGLVNTGSPSRLAGMTFDVQHINDGEKSSFKILRNEDFGAKLPSDLLCPSKGDPCTLIGWNIKAVQSTGIIEAAEQKLYDYTKEYKYAMEDNPFTFECTLFADFCINNFSQQHFADSKERVLVCADGKYFIVNNHLLLTQGQKIIIKDPTLFNGECKSRVIGFEYKLDMPWDSPKITVGETDAYSRLAIIERQIKS